MTSSPPPRGAQRRRLWAGPWWMTGPELRAALRTPPQARWGVAGAAALCLVGIGLLPDEDIPLGFAGLVWLLLAALIGVSRWTGARRRRAGLVRITLDEFDLLVALGNVPPDRIAAARDLQARWIAVRRDPACGAGDPATLEAWMRHLVAAPVEA